MALYHVVVFHSEKYTRNRYLLHVLTNNLKPYQHYISVADSLVDSYHPAGEDRPPLRFVGVEELPLDTVLGDDAVYFIGMEEFEYYDDPKVKVFVKDSHDQEMQSKIYKYKSKRLTLDIDDQSFRNVVHVLHSLNAVPAPVAEWRFLRTPRGMHFRAVLGGGLEFHEKLRVRGSLLDDVERIRYDEILFRAGLPGLADVLFNRKYYLEGEGRYAEYVEEPLKVSGFYAYSDMPTSLASWRVVRAAEYLAVKFGGIHKVSVPIGTRTYTVTFKADEVVEHLDVEVSFDPPAEPSDAYEFAIQFSENPMRYVFQKVSESDSVDAVKEKVVEAYRIIGKRRAVYVLNQCRFELANGVIRVHVPDELVEQLGIAIGAGGANVRTVEELVGMKIQFVQPRLPDSVRMKMAVDRLMRALTDDEYNTTSA